MSMTDNEIIKALEEFINRNENTNYVAVSMEFLKYTLDLINRQKAEIENLSVDLNKKVAEIERLREYEKIRPIGCTNCSRGNFSNSKFCSHCGTQLQGKKKDVKSKAIKEFAERLKQKKTYDLVGFEIVHIYAIDNLVKEMVGEG